MHHLVRPIRERQEHLRVVVRLLHGQKVLAQLLADLLRVEVLRVCVAERVLDILEPLEVVVSLDDERVGAQRLCQVLLLELGDPAALVTDSLLEGRDVSEGLIALGLHRVALLFGCRPGLVLVLDLRQRLLLLRFVHVRGECEGVDLQREEYVLLDELTRELRHPCLEGLGPLLLQTQERHSLAELGLVGLNLVVTLPQFRPEQNALGLGCCELALEDLDARRGRRMLVAELSLDGLETVIVGGELPDPGVGDVETLLEVSLTLLGLPPCKAQKLPEPALAPLRCCLRLLEVPDLGPESRGLALIAVVVRAGLITPGGTVEELNICTLIQVLFILFMIGGR